MTPEIFLSLLAATVQSGTPILYATLGEILTEKGGILNLVRVSTFDCNIGF